MHECRMPAISLQSLYDEERLKSAFLKYSSDFGSYFCPLRIEYSG